MMNKHNRLALALVLVIIGISFFVDLDSPTGLTIGEASATNVDKEVEKKIEEEGNVAVIVILKEDKGNFFVKGKEPDIREVKNDLSGYEFKEGHEFEEIDAFSGEITKTALNKLKSNPNVEKIQLDHTFGITLSDTVPLIRADEIHEKVINNNLTGKNTGVCVLDTGINYNHSDLVDNYVDGYDYVNDDIDPLDDHGHGTHVSGIVAGVAPEVKIAHVKVLNSGGSGLESDIIAGIEWCRSNKDAYNIKVITMSLGGGLFSDYCDSSFSALTTAINSAVNENITVIASSGNSGSTTHISSPACIEKVIGIGATDKNDGLWGSSNRNNILDLLAPGVSISSTAANGGYTIMTGTSMAAPHIAGGVAIMQQFESEDKGISALPSDIENKLKETGILIGSWKRIDVYGAVAGLDNKIPSLNVDSPSNTTYHIKVIDLNYSASDLFLDSIKYSINGGEEVIVNGNVTLNLEGGYNALNVSVNDSNGNMNSVFVGFSVDWPIVYLNSPGDNENDLDGIVQFNCNASSVGGLSNISLYHNASGNWHSNMTQIVGGSDANVQFDVNFTSDLVFIWTCVVYDINNNFDFGENRTLRIDYNTAPVINDHYPNITNVTINEPANQTFNISYSDSDGDSLIVGWYKNGDLVDSDYMYEFIGSYSSSGEYNITVNVSDGSSADSVTWSFIVNNVEYCGDGIKNSTEECDGSDFGGLTCSNYGYNSGSLSCNNCVISIGGCANSTSGGSGGGGGGSGGGGTPISQTTEEEKLLQEATAERDTSEGSGDVFEAFSEEQDIERSAGGEETVQSEIIEESSISEKNTGKFELNNIIMLVIGGIILVGILVLFIRKEWRYIRSRK